MLNVKQIEPNFIVASCAQNIIPIYLNNDAVDNEEMVLVFPCFIRSKIAIS